MLADELLALARAACVSRWREGLLVRVMGGVSGGGRAACRYGFAEELWRLSGVREGGLGTIVLRDGACVVEVVVAVVITLDISGDGGIRGDEHGLGSST